MASDIKLNDNAVVVEGNVGVGTSNPGRPLHVEGNEIHSGGPGAGFSFADRTIPALVNSPQSGERWVWYAHQKYARLWSGIDHIEVRPNINEPNQPATVYIPGELVVGGRIVGEEFQGDLRFLKGVSDKASDGSAIELVSMIADTLSLTAQGGTRKYLALHADIDSDTAFLVLNYLNGYKNGVRIEGNLHVTGVLTQASSIALKENVAVLSGQEALATLQDLQPVKYTYKADETKQPRLGFIAEDVPELVATAARDRLSPMDLIAVLTKAMQEQQQTITALIAKVDTLVNQLEGGAA
jgi:hypothetical protein